MDKALQAKEKGGGVSLAVGMSTEVGDESYTEAPSQPPEYSKIEVSAPLNAFLGRESLDWDVECLGFFVIDSDRITF